MPRDTRHWSERELLCCGSCRRWLPPSRFHEDYYFVNRPARDRYGDCTDCRDLGQKKITHEQWQDRIAASDAAGVRRVK